MTAMEPVANLQGNTQVPHVLHVVETWRPVLNGNTSRTLEIVTRQQRLGIAHPQIAVASRQAVYTTRPPLALPHIPVHQIPASKVEETVRRLRRWHISAAHHARHIQALARHVDIIHVHASSHIGLAAARAAKAAGKHLVCELRYDLAGAAAAQGSAIDRALEPLMRRYVHRHLGQADAVVVASESLKALMVAQGYADRAITVVPNGAAARLHGNGAAFRTAHNIAHAPLIGTTATMLRYEGLDRLIAMMDQFPNAVLVLIGDGPERAALEQAAAGKRNIIFTGRIAPEVVPDALAAIDVFVIPRRDKSITRFAGPLKMVEAMAAGKAIVATKVGDMTMLGAAQRAKLVPADNDAAFIGAIRPLLSDKAARQRLGEAAQTWIQANYNWDHCIQRYADVYSGVMS